MKETVDQFINRCMVDFVNDKVHVYEDRCMLADPGMHESQVWSIQTTKNYIDWLNEEE